MLQFIRDKTQGVTTWIIIIVICVSFAMFGISNYFVSGGGSENAAEVGDVPITLSNFKRAYRQLLEQQQISGQDLSAIDQQKLREVALQQLIQLTMLVQAAEKQGFLITDKEILDLLAQIPELQQDGKFNPDRLQHMLYAVGMTQTQFFQTLRQKLLISQVQESLIESGFALPREVSAYNELYHQLRDMEFAVIPYTSYVSSISSSGIGDDVIEAFYQSHLDEYQEPVQVRLNYVELSPGTTDFANKSDQLASLSYESPDSLDDVSTTLNLPIQTTPFFTAKGDSRKAVTKNPDVLRVAFTDDLIREKFNSDVINLDSGALVVVRVAEYNPQHAKPLSEVKQDIVRELKIREAKKQAYLAGEALSKEIARGKSLTEVAKQSGYKYFNQKNVTRVADDVNQQVLQNLFALPQQALPQQKTFQLENGNVVVMQLNAIHDAPSHVSDSGQTQITTQLAEDFGKIDYELYQRAVNSVTKVKRYPLPGNIGEE